MDGMVDGPATFLLTGLQDGTPQSDAARHHELVEGVVRSHGAVRSRALGEGDSVLAVFGSATGAVTAALAVQRECATAPALRVRIGLYTGEMRIRGGRDRTEVAVHRAARLRDVAHGGRTLMSAATATAVADALPDGAWLVDLGMPRLTDLSRPERVFELRHRDLAQDFTPLRPLDVPPNNLPVQLTSFVGRDEELAEVQQLLAEHRLVTLAGSGGCGKTRMAAEVAAEVADRWVDGAWWVALDTITDPALVAELTAATMRVLVDPNTGPLRALASQLRRQQLLLCLDTCEHQLDATAELAETVLRSCPDVSVLTTSREPLGVAGEAVWRVPSLREDEAVRLFADRAMLARPGFSLQNDPDAVGTVCRRLDGIPLAIELAAAWVRALTPAQIAAGMNDRFRLLAGGPRTVISRHRTLAASIDWSYDGLEDADREVLRRLAVFAGGFRLDAARAVCAEPAGDDVLPALVRLVDKSLVVVHEDGGAARYRLLDTIRQYAEDRLHDTGETAVVRDRHLDHYLAFAEAAEPELERDQDTWRAALQNEHDNFRAALRWGLAAADPERGRRLAAALARLWFLHGHTIEAVGFLNQAIELAATDTSALQGRLLCGLAMIGLSSGQPALAGDAAARGLRLAIANGDDSTRARCLVFSAYGSFYTDFQGTCTLVIESRRYAEAADDQFAADLARLLEACIYTIEDRHDEAVTLAREFFARCLARGERFCAVFARECEAYAALLTGDVRLAEALATEVVHIAEPLGDRFTVGHAVSNLAWIQCVAGKFDEGHRLMEPVVRSMEAAGPDIQVPLMAISPAKLHLAVGEPAAALDWFERAAEFARPTTDNWIVARALPGIAAALRWLGRVDEARQYAERAVDLARRLPVPHVLAEGLEEQAFLAAVDDPSKAEALHHQALAVRVQHGLRTFYVDSLEALAGLAARSEDYEAAARTAGASTVAREVIGYPRPPINQADFDATVDAIHAGLDDDVFAEAWAAGAALSLDGAVAYVTRARGVRGRPGRGWASLTSTELEVIRLVAEGLTNPEIGRRLFMSRATVKTHLSHVYAKLDVANRTELASLAATR